MTRGSKMSIQKLTSIKKFVMGSIDVLMQSYDCEMEELREKVKEYLQETAEPPSGTTKMEQYIIEVFTNLFLGNKEIDEAIRDFHQVRGIIEVQLSL